MEIGGRSMSLVKTYARIEELEQENAQLRLQIDMLKMERENDGWIPCSSGKMPEFNVDVNVTYRGNAGNVYNDSPAFYTEEGEWYWSDGEYARYADIIAWRPKAEPYQGDVDATKQ